MIGRSTASGTQFARYTTPQHIDRASHSLERVLERVAVDDVVTTEEVHGVFEWLQQHASLLDRHPFNDVKATLAGVLSSSILHTEEALDILWLCRRFTTDNELYDVVTSDMQRLQGMLGGITIDEIIDADKLEVLEDWMASHEHLCETYPYEEAWSQLTGILRDGKISADEHARLAAYFLEFLSYKGHRAVADSPHGHQEDARSPIAKLCAAHPNIEFSGRKFCLTGNSERGSRSQVAYLLLSHGATFSIGFRKDIDYLVIGAKGSPAWAHACYGRKVEQALDCQRAGAKMLIVQERDVWKAADSRA